MAIDKLKTKFFTGAWLTDVKHYFSKINEIIDYLNGTSGDGSYKVYTALVSQEGTNAPTAIVLENTLDLTLHFTREDVGLYKVVTSSKFIESKTWAICIPVFVAVKADFFWYNINEFALDITNGGVYADDALQNVPIEIRVYN